MAIFCKIEDGFKEIVKDWSKVGKIIRVVIANSDHSFVDKLVTSLQSQLNIQVVGTAFDGPGATEICADTLPDVALLSLHLPGVDGIKAAKSILDTNAQTEILIVASHQINSVDEYALQALKMGAKGYLPLSASPGVVAQAIQQVFERVWLSAFNL
ncbi:MAG: hypothetical protein B6243_11835 [Anaerolineaceae bacterium 4572_5.2]|nr:MAG: hypothetical protein B6243_11835 [Anaerolineaceae bacterium 4572_5.2]